MNEAKREVSRRRFLASGVGLAAGWKLERAARAVGMGTTAKICNTMPEQTVGPYYIADELLRGNIREGKPGLPLSLRLLVIDAQTCKPLPRTAVDVWHCDALGLYAGFTRMDPTGMGPGGPGGPPPGGRHGPPGPIPGFDPQHPGNRPGPPEGMGPPPAMKATDALTFLRGIQFTDSKGLVEFATVFPGFYMGRTNHIHFKVREGGRVVQREGKEGGGQTYIEGHTSHIGQVFFPEELTTQLMKHEPYAQHQIHRTTLTEDDIFEDQHGAESMARLVPVEAGRPERGYRAELVVAVDPTKTPAAVGMGPGGPHSGQPTGAKQK